MSVDFRNLSDLELMIIVIFRSFKKYGVSPILTSHLYDGDVKRDGTHATGRSFDFAPRPRSYNLLPEIANDVHSSLTSLGVKHLGRVESGHIHITLTHE